MLMPLIQELNASPKDFPLSGQGGCHVRLKSGDTVIVSLRLCDALRSYAVNNAIPLTAALARLMREIDTVGWA